VTNHAEGLDAEPAPRASDHEESALPPVDADERALFLDRILPAELDLQSFQGGWYEPLHSWARQPLDLLSVEAAQTSALEVCLGDPGPGKLEKRIRFDEDGTLEVLYHWDPSAFPDNAFFATELSLGADADLLTAPEASIWRFPITTFSKSERGFDETVQGESVTIRWPVITGWGQVRLTRI
jgi:hypothetical protein